MTTIIFTIVFAVFSAFILCWGARAVYRAPRD